MGDTVESKQEQQLEQEQQREQEYFESESEHEPDNGKLEELKIQIAEQSREIERLKHLFDGKEKEEMTEENKELEQQMRNEIEKLKSRKSDLLLENQAWQLLVFSLSLKDLKNFKRYKKFYKLRVIRWNDDYTGFIVKIGNKDEEVLLKDCRTPGVAWLSAYKKGDTVESKQEQQLEQEQQREQ